MQVTTILRMAHDLSLAAWFGGACMGAIGLNAATIEIDDHTQRTRVANAGWFSWAPVVGTAVIAHVGSAAALGRYRTSAAGEAGWCAPIRTALTWGAATATAVTGVAGRRVVRGGDVPVATAVKPIDATPADVARAQRLLRVAQWLLPAFTGGIWVVNAVQQQGSADR